jgi:hypothetical protein
MMFQRFRRLPAVGMADVLAAASASAKLDIDPQAWLAMYWPACRITPPTAFTSLPWNWRPQHVAHAA